MAEKAGTFGKAIESREPARKEVRCEGSAAVPEDARGAQPTRRTQGRAHRDLPSLGPQGFLLIPEENQEFGQDFHTQTYKNGSWY